MPGLPVAARGPVVRAGRVLGHPQLLRELRGSLHVPLGSVGSPPPRRRARRRGRGPARARGRLQRPPTALPRVHRRPRRPGPGAGADGGHDPGGAAVPRGARLLRSVFGAATVRGPGEVGHVSLPVSPPGAVSGQPPRRPRARSALLRAIPAHDSQGLPVWPNAESSAVSRRRRLPAGLHRVRGRRRGSGAQAPGGVSGQDENATYHHSRRDQGQPVPQEQHSQEEETKEGEEAQNQG